MKKNLLILFTIVNNLLFAQTTELNFDSESFDGSELSNPYVIGNYRITMTEEGRHPDYNTDTSIRRDKIEGNADSNGDTSLNSLSFLRDYSGEIKIIIESVDGEEFDLDSFYFNGNILLFSDYRLETNIISVEGFKNQVSVGTQTTGFSKLGTQSLNNLFDDVDKVEIGFEAIASAIWFYLDTFNFNYQTLSVSENKGLNKTLEFKNGSFLSVSKDEKIYVYNVFGQKLINQNLSTGIYLVKVIGANGNVESYKRYVD